MSVLLIDAGNTRLKWALCERGEFSRRGAFVYQWSALPAQFSEHWDSLLTTVTVDKLVLCNVVGDRLEPALRQWLDNKALHENAFQEADSLTIEPVMAQSQAFGVRCAYEQPAQLGADRWAALVAARHHIDGACCVVDCGTALTIDVLSAEGLHVGGLIAPGMAMMHQSLLENTAQIEADDVTSPSVFDVRDTASAVQAGIMAASVGAVQQVLQQCQERGLENPCCVLTGGDAQILLPALPEVSVFEAEWVLKGLAVICGEIE